MKLITHNISLAKEFDRLCEEFNEYFWLTYNLDVRCPYPERIKLLVTQCVCGVDEKSKNSLDELHQNFCDKIFEYYRERCDNCFFWIRGKYLDATENSDEKSKFHPKVYFFRNSHNKKWEAIVGSYNYTRGGFDLIQSSVLFGFNDDIDGSLYTQMLELISSKWSTEVYLSDKESTGKNKERYSIWKNWFDKNESDRVELPLNGIQRQKGFCSFHQELLPIRELKIEYENRPSEELKNIIETVEKDYRIEESYWYSDDSIADKLIGYFVQTVYSIYSGDPIILKKLKSDKKTWSKHQKNWKAVVDYSNDTLNGISFDINLLRNELDHMSCIMNPIEDYYEAHDKNDPLIGKLNADNKAVSKFEEKIKLIHPNRQQFQTELFYGLISIFFPDE